MTGAARSALRVKTPALAQLVVLTSSATSNAPSALRPACAAAAVKPAGEVTEPSGLGGSAAGIAGVNRSVPRRLVSRPLFLYIMNHPGRAPPRAECLPRAPQYNPS